MKSKQNHEEEDIDDLPEYEAIQIDASRIDKAHEFLDKYNLKQPNDKEESDDEVDGDVVEPNGGDQPYPVGYDDTPDNIDLPDSVEVAAHKYNIEPDIAEEQEGEFNPNRAFFGRHVVNSNTKRADNFRQLLAIDACFDYDLIPTRRQRATQLRQRTTAEYQMCRSNPEIGGFDRKLQRSVLKREDVDVKQLVQDGTGKKKKKKMFGL